MRRMKKRGPNVLYDLNDLLFFLTSVTGQQGVAYRHIISLLISEVSEEVATQSPKIVVVNNPTLIWGPRQEEPPRVSAYTLYFQKLVIGLHFCGCIYGSIFIQICAVGSKIRIFSTPECVFVVQARSRSSKVDDFGTNWKRVCDFLLVGHCDYGPILHRFWNTATYRLEIAYFSYPSLIRRSRSLAPYVPFGILQWS